MKKSINNFKLYIIRWLKRVFAKSRWILNLGRLFNVATKKFYADECIGKASSLSFVSVLSVVPVIILAFTALSYFGSTDMITKKIIPILLPGEGQSAIIEALEKFSLNVPSVPTLGIIFLIFVAVDAIIILERSINSIWQIKKGRSFIQNFLIYWATLTLSPLFLFGSFYLTSKFSSDYKLISFFFPLLITWMGFFFAYEFIPRTKVNIKAAFIGSLIGAIFWELGKLGFGVYINELAPNTFGKIYGSLFLIPVFFAWIFFSFIILFFGVEISYLIQYPELYRQKNLKISGINNFKLFIILNSLYIIYDSFQKGNNSVSLSQLSRQNNLSRIDMGNFMTELSEKNLIKEITSGSKREYFPLIPIEMIKLKEIISLITEYPQLVLKKGNEELEAIFHKVVHRIEQSKLNEFRGVTLKDLLDEPISAIISKAHSIGL